MPQTVKAFLAFLRQRALKTKQLYLLGDLFEYWAGDDDIPTPVNRQIVDAIQQVSKTGVEVFWIAGNRDFLVGERFADAAGLTLLPDPHVLTIAGRPIVLTHGDAQCTDDAGYMTFRAQVRNREWQHEFLALPLAQRKKLIEGMRVESQNAQRGKSYEIMDVNQGAIAALFDSSGVPTMIHGPTHRPARHDHGNGRTRSVLSDWDCDTETPRGGWIGVDAGGVIRRYGLDGVELP